MAGDLGAQQVLTGLAVSAGIAIGPAYVVESGVLHVPDESIAPEACEAEIERFHKALETSRQQLAHLNSKTRGLPSAAAEEMAVLLEAHQQMLASSRLVGGVEQRIRHEHMNAAAAVQAEIGAIMRGFAAMADSYMAARAADIRDVGNRLIRNLVARDGTGFAGLGAGSIVLAEEVTPADTALMEPGVVAGFAAVLGGAEGHSAIMARSLGLPAVLGVNGLIQSVGSGETIIVDGYAGKVLIGPDAETIAAYQQRRQLDADEARQLAGLRDLPAISRDQVTVALHANIEQARDLERAFAHGAGGVGLLRTEFLYMNRSDLPGEDEQFDLYRGIVERMAGRPVTIRTLDAGGEKLAGSLGNRVGAGPNPALGLRAVRLGLREPKILETQLAALLRASRYGNLRILLPMITTPEEVTALRAMLGKVGRDLAERGEPVAALPPVGAMIEAPAAALAADGLARVADFFAIGTNDLIQYCLAIDRSDEQVAHLYNPLHPAVLRLIKMTCQAAARAGVPVSVCGEMAGDPRYTGLLLGLGLRELSMAPASVPLVKRAVRGYAAQAAESWVAGVLAEGDPEAVRQLVDEGMGDHGLPDGDSGLAC